VVAAPVQPINFVDRSKHAVRYTPEEKEAAYLTWRVTSGRSLRRAAELTGIAPGTLSNWSRDDAWQARAAREDEQDAGALNRAMRGLGIGCALRAIERIEKMAENAGGRVSDRVQLEANVWLAGCAGVSPNKPLPLPVEPEPSYGHGAPMTADEIRRRQRELAGVYDGDDGAG